MMVVVMSNRGLDEFGPVIVMNTTDEMILLAASTPEINLTLTFSGRILKWCFFRALFVLQNYVNICTEKFSCKHMVSLSKEKCKRVGKNAMKRGKNQ